MSKEISYLLCFWFTVLYDWLKPWERPGAHDEVLDNNPDRIGIWKCWFLRRGARTGTNNKLNPHMTPSPGIENEPHWWEASALTTAPSLLCEVTMECQLVPKQQMYLLGRTQSDYEGLFMAFYLLTCAFQVLFTLALPAPSIFG